ncbi:MAG: adenylate/guanylate cyclase domain-containing protein [Rhizobiaceae bacterium]
MGNQPNIFTRGVAAISLSVRSKLLVAFLSITCLLIGLALFGLNSLQQANERTEALIRDQERIAFFNEANDIVQEAMAMILALTEPSAGTSNSTGGWFTQPGEDLVQLLAEVSGHLGRGQRKFGKPNMPDASAIQRLRQDIKNLTPMAREAHRLRGLGDVAGSVAVGRKQVFNRLRKLQREFYTTVRGIEDEMAGRAKVTASAYLSSRQNIVAAGITAIGAALLLGYSLSSSLLWPIGRIRLALGQIAGGSFDTRIAVPNRDELGELADNVNATSEHLGALYEEVESQRADLEAEHARSEALLYNLLPADIAARLKLEPDKTIADSLSHVAILFADIVDFTPRAASLPPEQAVGFLNRIFSRFDMLTEEHGLEKIKTIGDAYMVAAGMPNPCNQPVHRVARMALDMQLAAEEMSPEFPDGLQVRIGIHAGPAVAGVVGNQKLFYDVWGETVNTASRMESHGEPDRIQVTTRVKEELEDAFDFEPRGAVTVKGMGEVEAWFLIGAKVQI